MKKGVIRLLALAFLAFAANFGCDDKDKEEEEPKSETREKAVQPSEDHFLQFTSDWTEESPPLYERFVQAELTWTLGDVSCSTGRAGEEPVSIAADELRPTEVEFRLIEALGGSAATWNRGADLAESAGEYGAVVPRNKEFFDPDSWVWLWRFDVQLSDAVRETIRSLASSHHVKLCEDEVQKAFKDMKLEVEFRERHE